MAEINTDTLTGILARTRKHADLAESLIANQPLMGNPGPRLTLALAGRLNGNGVDPQEVAQQQAAAAVQQQISFHLTSVVDHAARLGQLMGGGAK